jgi:hypothetical protein
MTVMLEKRQTYFPFSMSNGITVLCMVLFITLVDVFITTCEEKWANCTQLFSYRHVFSEFETVYLMLF